MKRVRCDLALICVLILIVALPVVALAETQVSGLISSDTTWTTTNSPYIVTGGVGSVLVSGGVTLTIEPGVTVKFDTGKALQIDGTLIARGAAGNLITFTSYQPSPAPGDWGYILFSDSSADASYDIDGNYTGGSILEYVVVEYAGGVSVDYNGALRMNNAHPFVTYSLIRNNSASGIQGWNLSAHLKIMNNTISGNSASGYGGGIYTYRGTVTISGNTISGNSASSGGGGIYTGVGTVTILSNTISGNSVSSVNADGGGIRTGGGTVTILSNTISGNSVSSGDGGGIWTSGNSPTISNNTISGNSAHRGGGISISTVPGTVTISNNTISGNSAFYNGGGIYTWTSSGTVNISSNTISGNSASGRSTSSLVGGGGIYSSFGTVNISSNTITRNQAAGAEKSIVHTGANSTTSLSFTSNNIFNNIPDINSATYALWNNQTQFSPNLNAENNWWGTANDAEIQAMIYDWFDDSTKGIVDYSPYETAIRTDTPISPPTGLAITPSAGQLALSWSANPEPDTAGYIVYWGAEPGFPYANFVDVGNATGHTITGLPDGIYYVTVTAYDTGYSLSNDNLSTIVNENQTNGNESWYDEEYRMVVGAIIPIINVTPLSLDFGEVTVGSNSESQAIDISNAGTANLTVSIIEITGTNASEFSIQADNCTAQTLAPPGSCTVKVVFSPASAGLKTANLQISSDDPNTPTMNLPLGGRGLTALCIRGDMNQNGFIDILDVIFLLRTALGLQ